MSIITVKFKGLPAVQLNIANDDLGRRYYQLVKDNYQQQLPIFRDRPKYTVEYMLQLANLAKEHLGWNWSFDHYDIGITALLHKDIEQLLANGFDESVPAELDELLHELHYCLHIIQSPRTSHRDAWLQIEWYNDAGFDLNTTDIFQHNLKFGDIKLQNPYVGHGPLQVYLEQDFTNIPQTCKFHDLVRPGINIVIHNFTYEVETDKILEKFKIHAPNFVEQHGIEKIKSYIGYPVIGQVTNLEDLHTVAQAPILELDKIEFSD